MVHIESFVFFDIETTGLPWQERNQTKIVEASFVAVHRKELCKTPLGSIPKLSKLTFLLNPRRPIHPKVTTLTGLSNHLVRKSPLFKDKVQCMYTFLDRLPKPVCLLAHNGNPFDFKILRAECQDISASLPKELLCVDTILGFRKLLKGTTIDHKDLNSVHIEEDLLTDDEDEVDSDSENWPDLNISKEEWDHLDELCSSLSDVSFVSSDAGDNSSQELKSEDSEFEKKRDSVIKGVFAKKTQNSDYNCFKLGALYKRLLNKEVVNAHRAEADCIMLLECVIALREQFLPWADSTCKLLTDVEPLVRNFKKSLW